MIETGHPAPLGATPDDDGTNFAIFSSVAQRVELCLYDTAGHEVARHVLPANTGHTWHGYLPGCFPGQLYGYRVHGVYEPDEGLRCNPSKLLIDPYARAIAGEFTWHEAVFDRNNMDSAAYVPKSIVCGAIGARPAARPRIPWSEMIFYEANVRGYTMRHPAVAEADRGRFSGMRNADVIAYLKALGITSIELMPVHAFIDEHHLVKRGLRNFWGYNSISFFAPSPRYAQLDAIAEFRDMVRAFHDAGIEVVLDVVYNHTGEGDSTGPTLGFRGIDNLAYYRTKHGAPGSYVNDTGTGNTVNVDHPRVQQIVLDSLRYWHNDMGVDGFRFDLATVLGRTPLGYSPVHPLLEAISHDEALHDAVLVAEPWDPGPGGYQLGCFPPRWSEWNDRFRDDVRCFWRGDAGSAGEFAKRLHGSADIFERNARSPMASVNLVSSHDGFTLADVVSYEQRHNEANGEDNKDGHAHNFSSNYGVEGPTDAADILALRRRQRLNMLATLLVSQGIPLLLAGDEFGHSQLGNNNAYAQDNETGWLDWSLQNHDPDFVEQVRALLRLRRDEPLLRVPHYLHGAEEMAWLLPSAEALPADEWRRARAFSLVLGGGRMALCFNGSNEDIDFTVPLDGPTLVFASAEAAVTDSAAVAVPALSVAVLRAGCG
jgi:glycogen operon protein